MAKAIVRKRDGTQRPFPGAAKKTSKSVATKKGLGSGSVPGAKNVKKAGGKIAKSFAKSDAKGVARGVKGAPRSIKAGTVGAKRTGSKSGGG